MLRKGKLFVMDRINVNLDVAVDIDQAHESAQVFIDGIRVWCGHSDWRSDFIGELTRRERAHIAVEDMLKDLAHAIKAVQP